MINDWCSSYDKGEFPEGEHTVGEVVIGRPPLSFKKTESTTPKAPIETETNSNNRTTPQNSD
jgi:hypothetical protein